MTHYSREQPVVNFAARYSNVDNLKNLSFEVWRFRLMQRNVNTMQRNHNVKHRDEPKSV